MLFKPFDGNVCKSKLYFVEIFKNMAFILQKKSVMETQLMLAFRRGGVGALTQQHLPHMDSVHGREGEPLTEGTQLFKVCDTQHKSG